MTPLATQARPLTTFPVWGLVRFGLVLLVAAGLLGLAWSQSRPLVPPAAQPFSVGTQTQLSVEHDCTAPRDAIPGLVHYAVIRHYTEGKIAVVQLGEELDRYVDLGPDTGKNWYVVALCAK